MTWYADNILLAATPGATARLSDDPLLRPHSCLITNLDGHEWYRPEHRHSLPEGGLLVIRPVAAPDSHSASWYGEAVLDWSLPDAPPLSAALIDGLDATAFDYPGPPLSFRRFLASLAAGLKQPVLYHACAMWGGSIEQEYCFAYTPVETLFVTRPDMPFQTADTDPVIPYLTENALVRGLALIGIDSPTGYFAPHTRAFPWRDHAL